MKVLVTGVAGFIGSTLTGELLRDSHDVVGIDSINSYYPERVKRRNLESIGNIRRFRFVESDIMNAPEDIFRDTEVVFHLAGQPGVRASWGNGFGGYVSNNILATQSLLERLKHVSTLKRIVYASSSSVYGDDVELPLGESATPHPVSPYGVTKLAAEQLCAAYSTAWDIPVTCLRYFTVYGPRQRPDMAFHRFIKAGMRHETLPVYGDGTQTRDFTFIDDIVGATRRAGLEDYPDRFTVLNIGSGKRNLLLDVIDTIRCVVGSECAQMHTDNGHGDMKDTFADISRARNLLGYSPQVELSDGIREQYKWMKQHRSLLGF